MAPNPHELIGFGDIHGPKPYEFIGFGDIHGPKPYEFGAPSASQLEPKIIDLAHPKRWAQCVTPLWMGLVQIEDLLRPRIVYFRLELGGRNTHALLGGRRKRGRGKTGTREFGAAPRLNLGQEALANKFICMNFQPGRPLLVPFRGKWFPL